MKLSEKKLEALREVLRRKDESLLACGQLEFRKNQMLGEVHRADLDFQEIRSDLVEKYGQDVQVDMNDGTIVNASNDLKES